MFKGFVFFLKFSWKHGKLYPVCRFVTEIIGIAVMIADVVLPKYLINELFCDRRLEYAVRYMAVLILVNLAGSIFQSGLKFVSNNAKDTVRMCFEQEMMRKHMKTDYSFFERPDLQDLRTRAKQYVNGPFNEFGYVFEKAFTLFGALFTIASVIVIVINTNLFVLLVFMLFTVINVVVGAKVKAKNMELIRDFAPVLRRRGYYEDVTKNPAYAKEIRAFGLNEFILKKYDGYMRKFCKQTIPVHKQNFVQQVVMTLVSTLQQAVAYAYLLWQVAYKNITAGDFSMYLSAIVLFNRKMNEVIDVVLSIRQNAGFYKDFENYYLNGQTDAEGGETECKAGEIEFREVTFTYPGQEKPALRNVSVKIPYGQKIAVIGENGAGKTTFIKLLLGLYKPDAGKIMINGIDTENIDRDAYAGIFSAVFQDFRLFKLSLKENIAPGEERADQVRLENAIRVAGLEKKVLELPNGTKTAIYKDFDENGVVLSGGEAQKVALGRAYYRDAGIFIFDEPTASLDPKAECEQYERFRRVSEKKTTLFVSHRLSNSRFCDRILVFKNGMLTEDGNHEELISKKGEYSEMYSVQAGMYL